MNNVVTNISRSVLQHRYIALLMVTLLAVMVASGGNKLTFTDDERVFFSKGNLQLKSFEDIENTYTKNDGVIYIITPQSGDIFNKTTLSAIVELTKKAWQTPYSTRVDSISNFQHTRAKNDHLIVESLVSDSSTFSPTEINRIKEIALNEPLLVNSLISPSGHVTAVNVNVVNPQKTGLETAEIVTFSKKLKSEIETSYPGIKIRLNGGVVFSDAFKQISIEDMSSIVPMMYGIIILLMIILLRSLTGTLVTLIVVSTSAAIAMGFAGWVGITLNATSVNAPTMILTLAIADCVHVLNNMFAAMRNGMNKFDAIMESLHINFKPIVITSVTTSIGFLSMNFSDSPPFRDLGNIVAIGVIAAMFLSLILLPALMMILPVRVKVTQKNNVSFMERLSIFVIKHKNALLFGNVSLVLLATAGLINIELNDNFIKYFDQRYEIRQATDYMEEHLTGADFIEYSLHAGEEGGVSNPAYLETVEAFANWYRLQENVVHVKVITDLIKRLNKNIHDGDYNYYRIPKSRDVAAQNLLMYEMSLPYGLDLSNQINMSKSATRVTVVLKSSSAKKLRETDQKARNWLAQNAPEYMYTHGSSVAIMFAHISKNNIEQMLTGTTLALFLISLLLIFALRSLKLGFVSLIPNFVPALMAFGIWGSLIGQMGVTIAVVGSLTLGIIVDDTVHFLSKYQRAREIHKMAVNRAIQYTFTTVGGALLITTIVLVTGFSTLAFSGFKLNADLGIMAALTIAIALIIDFFLLPTLLLSFDNKKQAHDVNSVSRQDAMMARPGYLPD